MCAWLDREVGRGDYAMHAGSTVGSARNVAAFYFRAADPAHRFIAAFPDMVLADGTESPVYRSPYLPDGRPQDERSPMCNLYSMLRSQDAMRRLFDAHDRLGNQPPLPGIYPDYAAPSSAMVLTVANSSPRAGACRRHRPSLKARTATRESPTSATRRRRTGGHGSRRRTAAWCR